MIERSGAAQGRTTSLGRRAGHRLDDRGSAIVESALVTPIVIIVLLAVFEYGLLFRDYLTMGDALGDAARAGAVQGNRPAYITSGDDQVGVTADFTVVGAVRSGLVGIPIESIEGIIVFRAQAPGAGEPLAQVPAACKSAKQSSPAAACNYYPARDAFEAFASGDAAYFRCEDNGPACGWPPGSREDGPSVWDIDYLGVYVVIDRPFITGIVGQGQQLEYAAIQRLEPGRLEDD